MSFVTDIDIRNIKDIRFNIIAYVTTDVNW